MGVDCFASEHVFVRAVGHESVVEITKFHIHGSDVLREVVAESHCELASSISPPVNFIRCLDIHESIEVSIGKESQG